MFPLRVVPVGSKSSFFYSVSQRQLRERKKGEENVPSHSAVRQVESSTGSTTALPPTAAQSIEHWPFKHLTPEELEQPSALVQEVLRGAHIKLSHRWGRMAGQGRSGQSSDAMQAPERHLILPTGHPPLHRPRGHSDRLLQPALVAAHVPPSGQRTGVIELHRSGLSAEQKERSFAQAPEEHSQGLSEGHATCSGQSLEEMRQEESQHLNGASSVQVDTVAHFVFRLLKTHVPSAQRYCVLRSQALGWAHCDRLTTQRLSLHRSGVSAGHCTSVGQSFKSGLNRER